MPDDQEKKEEPSRLGKFIQTYHSFLSSFVISAAGLIATSIWQYRAAENASQQAKAQQELAQVQFKNSWQIERAEILSKNLQVLASSGENTVEQRYGVLLSLTRGNILDPEIAVSYALELGKDNPDYMQSVLSNTSDKNYDRLAQAFEPSCLQRFGVARDVPICKADAHAGRSDAIAELFGDELDKHIPGPLTLLDDEREVQTAPLRLSWLFTPYLSSLYERRQWKEIEHFEKHSSGARLISALVLGPTRRDELVATSEVRDVDQFHDKRVQWLEEYVEKPSCEADCKGKLADCMLTFHAQAVGDFDRALRKLLGRPRVEVTSVVGRFHARLLACQLDTDDVPVLRDRVLLPALSDELANSKPDLDRVKDLLSLLILVPEPKPDDRVPGVSAKEISDAADAWRAAMAKTRTLLGDGFRDSYTTRRAAAEAQRQNPPPALRRALFCSAQQLSPAVSEFDE